MKLYNKLFLMAIGCATLNSCSDMDNIDSEGFRITDGQIEDTNELIPSRVESSLVGMYHNMQVLLPMSEMMISVIQQRVFRKI